MRQILEQNLNIKKISWPDFFRCINEELIILEDNLRNKLPTKSSLLKEVVSYIFNAGGKRLRPAICFLTAKGTGRITDKHIILSELTELIHTASLIHDDIIDSAKLRRGRETINNLWNDKISVITGDFLFAQASIRLGKLENTEIVKIYAKVLSDLCDGEIEQYSVLFNTNISWEDYINKSTAKTASLFAACCKSAAILNEMDTASIAMAHEYGNFLGIAFQIVDDILDFTGSSAELGKEAGSDLKQGTITAPALFALKSNDSRARQLKSIIENKFDENTEDFKKAVQLIHELGGCEKAKRLAMEYSEKSKETLYFIKDHEIKSFMLQAADFVLERIS